MNITVDDARLILFLNEKAVPKTTYDKPFSF